VRPFTLFPTFGAVVDSVPLRCNNSALYVIPCHAAGNKMSVDWVDSATDVVQIAVLVAAIVPTTVRRVTDFTAVCARRSWLIIVVLSRWRGLILKIVDGGHYLLKLLLIVLLGFMKFCTRNEILTSMQ
jgi:hypothetical protein